MAGMVPVNAVPILMVVAIVITVVEMATYAMVPAVTRPELSGKLVSAFVESTTRTVTPPQTIRPMAVRTVAVVPTRRSEDQ